MRSFNKRRRKGKELEDYLVNKLNEYDIGYFLTGYEGLKYRNNALDLISLNNTPTSFFVRHYPDYTLAFEKESFLIEIKNSTGIEREAWDAYKALRQDLHLNVLMLLKDRRVYNIDDIKFRQIHRFDARAGMDVPVLDGIWKAPRLMPQEKYYQYLKAYDFKTSGCTFAYIDFERSIGHPLDILVSVKHKYSK